jgi:hypothetical protein
MSHAILETLTRKQEERTDPGERAFAREVVGLAGETVLRLSLGASSSLVGLGAALSAAAAMVLAADREASCPQGRSLELLRQLIEEYAQRPEAREPAPLTKVQA